MPFPGSAVIGERAPVAPRLGALHAERVGARGRRDRGLARVGHRHHDQAAGVRQGGDHPGWGTAEGEADQRRRIRQQDRDLLVQVIVIPDRLAQGRANRLGVGCQRADVPGDRLGLRRRDAGGRTDSPRTGRGWRPGQRRSRPPWPLASCSQRPGSPPPRRRRPRSPAQGLTARQPSAPRSPGGASSRERFVSPSLRSLSGARGPHESLTPSASGRARRDGRRAPRSGPGPAPGGRPAGSPRIGAGRAQHADGAVGPAVGDDEPVVVGQHDPRVAARRPGGRPGGCAGRSPGPARSGTRSPMSSPAATSTISSHRGRPPAARPTGMPAPVADAGPAGAG